MRQEIIKCDVCGKSTVDTIGNITTDDLVILSATEGKDICPTCARDGLLLIAKQMTEDYSLKRPKISMTSNKPRTPKNDGKTPAPQPPPLENWRTFDEWASYGCYVSRGEKSTKINEEGQALFSDKQVYQRVRTAG